MPDTEPPEPARVVVLMLGDNLPPALVADLLGEAAETLALHGFTGLQTEGNAVTALPPVETTGRHAADETEAGRG